MCWLVSCFEKDVFVEMPLEARSSTIKVTVHYDIRVEIRAYLLTLAMLVCHLKNMQCAFALLVMIKEVNEEIVFPTIVLNFLVLQSCEFVLFTLMINYSFFFLSSKESCTGGGYQLTRYSDPL